MSYFYQSEWTQLKQLWKAGNYEQALAMMDENTSSFWSSSLLSASNLNDLTGYIENIEQLNDPDWDTSKVQVAKQPPADLTNGQIYFELAEE